LAVLLFLVVQYRLHKRKWVFIVPLLLVVGTIAFGILKLDPWGKVNEAIRPRQVV
jgi:hypothetical protein